MLWDCHASQILCIRSLHINNSLVTSQITTYVGSQTLLNQYQEQTGRALNYFRSFHVQSTHQSHWEFCGRTDSRIQLYGILQKSSSWLDLHCQLPVWLTCLVDVFLEIFIISRRGGCTECTLLLGTYQEGTLPGELNKKSLPKYFRIE